MRRIFTTVVLLTACQPRPTERPVHVTPPAPVEHESAVAPSGDGDTPDVHDLGVPDATTREDDSSGAAAERLVASTKCSSDADCTLTHVRDVGCCGDCDRRAVSRTWLEAKQRACAGTTERCPPSACEPLQPAIAECRDGICRMRPEGTSTLR